MKLRSVLLATAAAALTAAVAAQAQVPGINSTLNTVFTLAYDNSTMKQTYSASIAGLASPNNGGDVCSLYGSATKNIRLRRVIVSGFSGALQTDPISIVKRSSIAIGGTLATVDPFSRIPYDSSNDAATATTEAYTVVPTTAGTLVGLLADVYITLAGATTAVAPSQPYVFTFGQLGQPVVLRGAAQHVDVNTGGLAAITMSCMFEWTEEAP